MNSPQILSQLSVLKRQYFQLVEVPRLKWPENAILKIPQVQSWLFSHLFDTKNVANSPLERYQLKVLKTLVSKLEESMVDPEEDEISDDLLSAMSPLLISNFISEADSAQQKSLVTYSFPTTVLNSITRDARTVTLFEARSVISSTGTTGLRTWEAALALGSYLTSEIGHGIITGKRVFELGAGTGMLSILCAKYLNATGVVATDGDETVVDAIKSNIFLNDLDTNERIHTAALKWGRCIDITTFPEDYGMDFPDVVLGADITYDIHVLPHLISTIREFFEVHPILQVLISATIRNEQTFETFLNACRRNSFVLTRVPFVPTLEDLQDGPFYSTSIPIHIWEITKER